MPGPPYICLHPFSSGFPIRIAHCSSRTPTEQERPGMYARSSKAPSRPQLILVTGKIVISRQAHEMGWDENHIDPRPTTETSHSRSVAQQGAPYRQERRVNLHATEDVPVTRVRPDPIRSQPISLPTRLQSAELQLPHPRSMIGSTLQRPSNRFTGSDHGYANAAYLPTFSCRLVCRRLH
jgi:hypothetical protein